MPPAPAAATPEAKSLDEHPLLSWSIGITGSVIVLAVGIGIGLLFEKGAMNAMIANRDVVIDDLRQQVLQLQQEASTSAASMAAMSQEPEASSSVAALETPATPEEQFAVFGSTTLPKDGESYCQGEPVTISWNVNSPVDEVRLSINSPTPLTLIDDMPATWNEDGTLGRGSLNWAAGQVKSGTSTVGIPDGELYRIRMEALNHSKVVGTKESGTFMLETCKG